MHKTFNKLKPYFFNVLLIWLIVLIYSTTKYYTNFLRPETQATILYLAIAYTVIGLIYYLLKQRTNQTTGLTIFNIIKKIAKLPSAKSLNITKQEKTTALFVLVKFFFLPLMLNFFYSNLFVVKSQISNLPGFLTLFTTNSFNHLLFPLIISFIFLIDTLYFSFGYSFESNTLKNKIRSVEPTIFGWIVALICYPPFNSLFTKYIDWHANIYIFTSNNIYTFIIKISIIILLLIYLSATLSLGTKCSNLTNRGIISRGPYSIVRHPAYISKNLVWWITIIPIATWPAIISMVIWSSIYHLRTITEERHLSQDPDYIEYCKKVKYRYIPRIY